MRARAWLLFACAACAREAPPPLPEAILVVDTDLPVPLVVSRLRIDLYSADGTWFESRDDLRPDPRDWPSSFSVYSDDESRGRTVYVRLRAYPDARLVRYSGAIDATPRELRVAIPRGDGTPRLVRDGVDRTPDLEPDPRVTIDRLVRVRLTPGMRGHVPVTLRGACAGAVAKIAPASDAASCVDGDPLTTAIDGVFDDAPRGASEVGSFARVTCAGASDGTTCIDGGSFVLGDAFFRPSSAPTVVGAQPERIVALSPFRIDTDEVSVARFRAAVDRGFAAPRAVGVTEKDGPLDGDPGKSCTFSAAPRGREDYPLSCVPWETARAFCVAEGGELPTETQLEYAALAAGRTAKSLYPWGDDPPSCDRAIFGRALASSFDGCIALGEGPQPGAPTNDVSASKVRNLAGSLAEHTLDTWTSFDAPCWLDAPMKDPSCVIPLAPKCAADPDAIECNGEPTLFHTTRGASWLSVAFDLRIVGRANAARIGKGGTTDGLQGFRCVHSTN